MPQDRVTHDQMLFSWNPSPLRSSKFSFEYLLLPPRSAPGAAPPRLTPKAASQTPMPSYSLMRTPCNNGWVLVARLSAIHFRGQSIRQVSCYTLLSGFRLPGPPSCCLYEPTPFLGSHEPVFGHLISTLGSSLIASSAYQKWPTKNSHSVPYFSRASRASYQFKV